MFEVTLQRRFSQVRDQNSGIEYIKTRAVVGGRSRWSITNSQIKGPHLDGARYIYTCTLTFEKRSGSRNEESLSREWNVILENLVRLGNSARFQAYPWNIVDESTGIFDKAAISKENVLGDALEQVQADAVTVNDGAHHALSKNTGVTLAEVKERVLPIIDGLLSSEEALTNSEYFKGIFARNPQIRSILSSVKSFLETDGQRRNHVLLWGLPACAKTQILTSITRLLGDDAVVRLDGTSTTPAGIYKVYFDEFDGIPEPPFVVLEEAEKTSEDSLRVWLGALDDRGELRKINARQMRSRDIKILCLATANDKDEFDHLMGGTAHRPGALSSRFVHQLKCPRPDRQVLKMILMRDIHSYGGKEDWVEPALDLATQIETDDPRKVLGFLDGGDRLLTGAYQKDLLQIYGKAAV